MNPIENDELDPKIQNDLKKLGDVYLEFAQQNAKPLTWAMLQQYQQEAIERGDDLSILPPPMPASLVIRDNGVISHLYSFGPTFDGGRYKPKLPSKVTLTSPENPDVKIICHRNSDKELEFGIVHKGLGKGELLRVTITAEGTEPKVVYLVTEVFASPAEANYCLNGYKETDPKNLQFEIEDGIDVTTLSDVELNTLAQSHREVIAAFSEFEEVWREFAKDHLQDSNVSPKLQEVLSGIFTGQATSEKPQFEGYPKPEDSLNMPRMMKNILNRS